MATTETLPRPPCPWTYPGAPLSCGALDAPTTYRVRYEPRPDRPDTYSRICIEVLGGTYPGKVQSLPTCAEHDAAVESAFALLGTPAALHGGWIGLHAAPAGGAVGPIWLLSAPGAAGAGIFRTPVLPVPAGSAHLPAGASGDTAQHQPPATGGTIGTAGPQPHIPAISLPAGGAGLALALLALALCRGFARRRGSQLPACASSRSTTSRVRRCRSSAIAR